MQHSTYGIYILYLVLISYEYKQTTLESEVKSRPAFFLVGSFDFSFLPFWCPAIMGIGVLPDRLMEHVPGMSSTLNCSRILFDGFKALPDTSMIPRELSWLGPTQQA